MTQAVLKERGKKYVGLPEFAQVAERILAEMDFEQERGTVTSVPDERTIRYYLAEGLIETPNEKQGTASLFGYLNLLQLLTIKKLQAEHLPIRKIRELVAGRSEEELEMLLGVGSSARRSYTRTAERVGDATAGKKTRETEAKKYLESLLTSSMPDRFENLSARAAGSVRAKQMSAPPAAAMPAQGEQSWQRVEIEPGLELHIRSDYAPPTSSARTRNLADRIRSVISRYWREK
jgi:DNA-binding transcriptional MerR regulator